MSRGRQTTPADSQDVLSELKAQIESLTNALDFQKELSALRHQFELEVSHLKWAAATAGILITLMGFFGVKAWKDLTENVHHELSVQVSALSDQAFDLSQGFVLADSHRFQEAIPFLERCHARNRYDESVTSALLDAFMSNGDYTSALTTIEDLKSDPKKFRQLTNPRLLNNIGRALIFKSLESPDSLDEAQGMLESSLRGFPSDAYSAKFPMFNLFRLYLLKHDGKRAAYFLSGAYTIDKGYASEAYTDDAWMRKAREKAPDVVRLAHSLTVALTKP